MAAPKKSPDAFRTISEVASWLETPAHVLRFWESRFPEISPVKGAGGRRYYRPDDMRLLGGIKRLLHEDGNTIKAVQEQLAADGVASVAALSPSLPMVQADNDDAIDPAPAPAPPADATADSTAERPPIGYYFDDSAEAEAPAPSAQSRGADRPAAAKPTAPSAPVAGDIEGTLVLEPPLARAMPSLDHVPADQADPDPARPFSAGLSPAAVLRELERPAAGQADLAPLAARLRRLRDRAR